ncbi:MAG TPA: adenylate/guanylate cyclase domain-containing protein [Propionibacteriaceae bacterium]|jgi:adenylate cyclase|nr:adenylate/guanylate cyclase domain-containing protein [Propionibacteriaceae bacterium]HEX5905550.1 adenylate/guanylate cyclase domain-containing protein [Propionibacteriaceae bacterium]HEX5962260.1 adenylate/guanylate cyclase domain-containing protein [Gemmatimonadales bacterium]
MTSDRAAMNGGYDEEFWREFLSRGQSRERRVRDVFKRIPHDPRCKLCAAPFAGAGAPVMRLIGKRPAEQNPNICRKCFTFLSSHHGGAEIDVTMLFADIRGSTTLAEDMSTADFRRLLDRFYTTASGVVFAHDGMVDKFVGDELVANFFPLLTGDRHAIKGVDAARDLLRATGHEEPAGPWVPLGAGLHTARTWFGAVGRGGRVELTAVGDAVNTTARLASLAAAGEILVTIEAATAAALDLGSLDRQQLELKGKRHAIEVVRLRIGPADSIAAA